MAGIVRSKTVAWKGGEKESFIVRPRLGEDSSWIKVVRNSYEVLNSLKKGHKTACNFGVILPGKIWI